MNLGEKLRRLKPMTPKTKAVVAAERAVVEAAMAWADVTTNIQADHLERACDRLLAARKRGKK